MEGASRPRRVRRSRDEGRTRKAAPGGEADEVGKRLKFLRAQPFGVAGTGQDPCPRCCRAASSQPAFSAVLPPLCPLKTAGLQRPGWRTGLRAGLLLGMGVRGSSGVCVSTLGCSAHHWAHCARPVLLDRSLLWQWWGIGDPASKADG